VKASQQTTAPTTDIDNPQISMLRKSFVLSAVGGQFAMKTAPVVA